MDNEQFVFGQALKTSSGYLSYLANAISHFYLTRVKGFDMSKICVATVVTEGTAEEVAAQEAKIHSIAVKYQGMAAGGNNGKRGYQLTFAIAYIRVRVLLASNDFTNILTDRIRVSIGSRIRLWSHRRVVRNVRSVGSRQQRD